MSRRMGLSKSRITLYEQCPKRLWLSVHRPELAEQTGATTASMRTGHEVGAIACTLLPEGYMIEAHAGLAAAVAETSALLGAGWNRPLFEATFAHEDVLVRVDLMLPTGGGWHVAEVKSTCALKPYHLGDLATQLWVMRGCGVDVASASIRHLDATFTLLRERDYDGLFADTHIDRLVEPLIATRPDIVAGARETLLGDEPVRDMGAHCEAPFQCSYKGHCGRDLPSGPEWPASLLPGAAGKKLARTWAGQGVEDLTQVPADAMTSPKLARVHAATLTGMPHHDGATIAAETSGWSYPRTFLDIETIQFAIPRWVGTRPYEQVPFQFSAHIVAADGSVSHQEYLSLDGSDPRRGCAEALARLPQDGAVIAWNAGFERSCLLALAAVFPELAQALHGIAARLVDLLPVVRRHYYHRDMRGSWSLKAVLPTIAADLGYDGLLEVKSGTDAQAGYAEAIDPATTLERREAIGAALETYCQRDTEAMMVVLERLTGAAE